MHLAQVRGNVLDRYERELRTRFPKLSAGVLRIPSGHTVLGRIWASSYGRVVVFLMTVPFFVFYCALLIQSYRFAKKTEPELAATTLIASAIGVGIVGALFMIALAPNRVVEKEAGRLDG